MKKTTHTTASRRHILKIAGLSALAPVVLSSLAQPTPKSWQTGTKLVLLGTMAGPVLHPSRAMSSQIVFVDGRGFLIDCGYGAIGRMTEMGIKLSELQQVYFTHHHSDHTADYPALTNLAWIIGIKDKLKIFGPTHLQKMHEAALLVFSEDSDIRIKATGRLPIARSFEVTEIGKSGLIYQDDKVKITAVLVDHPPFEAALAYRFDTSTRSIVISGDTAPSEALVQLARGADILVHEAMYKPAIDQMLAKRPYVPPTLKKFLEQGHTTAEEAGQLAARVGVKTLVLSHLLPGDEPISEEVWRGQAAKYFKGEIVVGNDKLVL
jgi:ribonuclease BN (tRNA processing enzyme)